MAAFQTTAKPEIDAGPQPVQDTRASGSKHPLAEIVILITLIELIMWVVPLMRNDPRAYGALALLIAVLLAVCFTRDDTPARELGLTAGNLVAALLDLLPFLAGFVVLVFIASELAGTMKFGTRFLSMLAAVPVWALLQQYMLLAFAHRRFQMLWGKGTPSRMATAALFALMHLPNPALTIACAFGGYVWVREYDRKPNLFANAITHTIASAFMANALPHSLLRNMVVGYNYFFR